MSECSVCSVFYIMNYVVKSAGIVCQKKDMFQTQGHAVAQGAKVDRQPRYTQITVCLNCGL